MFAPADDVCVLSVKTLFVFEGILGSVDSVEGLGSERMASPGRFISTVLVGFGGLKEIVSIM